MPRYIDAEKIKYTEYINGDVTVSKDLVKKIPTADVVEIVRCKDCKYFVSEICRHDLAMNLICADDFCSYGEKRNEPAETNLHKIEHGKWVHMNNKEVKCSHCSLIRNITTQDGWNFCPSCGAKMNGDKNE